MRSIPALLAVYSLIAATAPPARAQDCDGDPGFLLVMPDTAAIGASVKICMYGPANGAGLFLASLGQGPLQSPFGTIFLDFPVLVSLPFKFTSEGDFCFTADVPCEPSAIDLTIYAQFITGKPDRGISNQDSIVITDGLCPGDLVTYTEDWYGEPCFENRGGCRLESEFDRIFPNGLVVGDHGGTENGFFALKFTSAAAVEAFLPANDGEAENLDSDQTDPTSSNSGDVAGQLAAARINLAFDDAGVYDDLKARPDIKLGDLIFVAGVNPDFFGMSVRDVLDIADLFISGALGEGDVDIDGDGQQDATIGDLSDALKSLNKNFQDGTINRAGLGPP